jgi:hypothetical protein
MYIEIMAPRPDAKDVPAYFLTLETLTPIDWAVRVANVNRTKEKLKAAGFLTTESKDGSRAKPDGTRITWTTFGIEQHDDFPFFIEWGAGSAHPSATSPTGCSLKSFHINTPDDEAMNKLNTVLQLGATLSTANKIRLRLGLETPNGTVTF